MARRVNGAWLLNPRFARGVGGKYISHAEENIEVARRMDGAALVESVPHNPGNPGNPSNPFPQDYLIAEQAYFGVYEILPPQRTGLITGSAAGVEDLRRSRSVFEAPAAPPFPDTGIEWGTINWPALGLIAGAALVLGFILK